MPEEEVDPAGCLSVGRGRGPPSHHSPPPVLLPPAGGHAVESPGGANLVKELIGIVQRSAKVCAPGLVNLIIAVADHFCPSLPAALTQPETSLLANLCTGQN